MLLDGLNRPIASTQPKYNHLTLMPKLNAVLDRSLVRKLDR
ncbi:hypothetical protein J635_4152 [Acinetobacter baumannii 233846]|nr:hypothetical protein J635_4152 [Acinetobacter baumannii 233846]